MITSKFDPKKQHDYVKGKINEQWYYISHFVNFDGKWYAWFSEGKGYDSGMVAVNEVQEFEVAE